MITKTKRQELLAKMQMLIAEAGDNMTEEQSNQFNALRAQIELMDAAGADENGVLPRKVPLEDCISKQPQNKSGWMDAKGNSVRVYGHKDKMGTGEYSLGKFVKGILTGSWQGAEAEHELFATTTTNNLTDPLS